MSHHVLVGLDCGGSRSRLAAYSGSECIFEMESGPANWSSSPREMLERRLFTLFENCPPPSAVAACFAGLLTADDAAACRSLVGRISKCSLVACYPDSIAAWKACEDPEATVVIAGTGSLILSRHPVEGWIKSGGGGVLIDDCGSGTGFGRRVLSEYLRRGPFAPEVQAFLEEELLGADRVHNFNALERMNEVVAAIYRVNAPAEQIARIGSKAAARNESWTNSLLEREMGELAQICKRHMELLPTQGRVFRTGGFWESHPRSVEYFESVLGFSTLSPTLKPLQGAVNLAAELLS